MITRGEQLVLPRGSTAIEQGDHVFVVLRPDSRARVDEVFASRST
jgi:cell volume regulation protein A